MNTDKLIEDGCSKIDDILERIDKELDIHTF